MTGGLIHLATNIRCHSRVTDAAKYGHHNNLKKEQGTLTTEIGSAAPVGTPVLSRSARTEKDKADAQLLFKKLAQMRTATAAHIADNMGITQTRASVLLRILVKEMRAHATGFIYDKRSQRKVYSTLAVPLKQKRVWFLMEAMKNMPASRERAVYTTR